MDLLNENSLASLLNNCYRNRGYRACILFNNREDAHTLLNELVEIHNQDGIDGVDRFVRNNPPQVRFDNGSVLTFLTTTNAAQLRGYRCNEALLHEDVMDTDAMITLQSHIREYVDTATNGVFETINGYATQAAERATQAFHRQFQAIWGAPENPDVEIKVDKKSKEVVDDFLDSFKIHNSLEFGS